jgi:PadR family transcriptional regulator PadR
MPRQEKKATDQYLGEFEEIVMLAILRLGVNAYGVTIRREIESQIQRTTSVGAVYTTLERLEKKGYVTSRHGEPTAERGGRAKRYFQVEGAGADALERAMIARQRLLKGVRLRRLPTRT